MSDETETNSTNSQKQTLTYIQIVVGILILFSTVGNFYVYKYKADEGEKWRDDFSHKFEEYQKVNIEAMSNLTNRIIGLETKQEASRSTLEEFRKHVADPTIHSTQDQLKNMVAAQLAPIQNNLTEMKTKLDLTIPNQQKQLDRIEDMLKNKTESQAQSR